jgi:phosphoenolpyruvate carboxylase
MKHWKGLQIQAEGEGISPELSRLVNLLGSLLGQVVRDQAGKDVFDWVESVRNRCKQAYSDSDTDIHASVASDLSKLSTVQLEWLVRSFTTFFHLINKAEQEEIIRINREREKMADADNPRSESIGQAIKALKDKGLSFEQVMQVIAKTDIQPTLTAHPTEARRRSVLYIQKEIAARLSKLNREPVFGRSETELFQEIYNEVVLMLNTDDVRASKIRVEDEIANGIYFLTGAIWEVIPSIHRDVNDALEEYFGRTADIPALVKYRTWIGGDRDGNPFVTADLSRYALGELRKAALLMHKNELQVLRRELSISERQAPISSWFVEKVHATLDTVTIDSEIRRVYIHEPFRLWVNILLARIDAQLASPSQIVYPVAEYSADIEFMRKALVESGFDTIASYGRLERIRVLVKTFGFHLAALDVRQHSDIYGSTVAELMRISGVEPNYASLSEEQKCAILRAEIDNPRPLVPRSVVLSPDTQSTIDTFLLIRDAIRFDPGSIGSVIISMTHHLSQLLEVVLLAKETGNHENFDVVPLFETIEDLQNSAALMKAAFEDPCYAKVLDRRERFQEIMLGYSDSNKDGGYWMANWALHLAQKSLAETCAAYKVDVRLFHGRGGTVGRGGGRANQAVTALPRACHNGRIRFTEQGEVISFRYANPDIAHRHIEQVVNAVFRTTAKASYSNQTVWQQFPGIADVIHGIADESMKEYRDLIDHKSFWAWYTSITPIEHISRLPIASRPVSRKTGSEVDFNSLRAIPWVFAWTQVRYNVPGWYGIGKALTTSIDRQGLPLFQDLYREWPFFKAVIDNAQREMGRANLKAATWYGRGKTSIFHQKIETEFALAAKAINAITSQSELMERTPVIRKSIRLRNPYTDVLNLSQVELMRRWDTAPEGEKDALRHVLFLSINGIAAAMQSTG